MSIIDKSNVNRDLYNKLQITLGEPIILETKKGSVKFPVSISRVNAYVCAWCGKTDYKDPFGEDSLDPFDYDAFNGSNVNEIDALLLAYKNQVPIILFLEKGDRGAIEFHPDCFFEVIGVNN